MKRVSYFSLAASLHINFFYACKQEVWQEIKTWLIRKRKLSRLYSGKTVSHAMQTACMLQQWNDYILCCKGEK